MRKEKLKFYKGKRVVIGDKNLVTKHEIHIDDLNTGGGNLSNSYTYFDISNTNDFLLEALILFSYVVKLKGSRFSPSTMLVAEGLDNLNREDLTAACVDEQMYITFGSKTGTIGEFFSSQFGEEYNNLPRMTKEEFFRVPLIYNIVAVDTEEGYIYTGGMEEFFETAYEYLKNNCESGESIQLIPSSVCQAVTVEYPGGGTQNYQNNNATWEYSENEEGIKAYRIELENYAGIFRKEVSATGDVSYYHEVLT